VEEAVAGAPGQTAAGRDKVKARDAVRAREMDRVKDKGVLMVALAERVAREHQVRQIRTARSSTGRLTSSTAAS